MQFKKLLSLSVILLMASSFAETNELDKFRQVINKYSVGNGPGFVAGVYQNNKPIIIGTSGLASIELGVPIKKNHIFRIASLTKQFTAAAILKLAENNQLKLSDDLRKYIKDYPTESHVITIAHLLSHTSGLDDFLNIPDRMDKKVNEPATAEEVMAELHKDPMLFAPGEATAYSNTAYILLGRIIEIVSGQSYAEYLDEKFFIPLDMTDTAVDSSKVTLNHVTGYESGNGNWKNAPSINMAWVSSAGALMSTVDDMSKWFFGLSSGKVLSKESFQIMTTPFRLNNGEQAGNTLQQFGFGLMRSDLLGLSMIGHTGNINGYNTYAEYSEKTNSYVVVLVNVSQDKIDSVGLARELSAIQNKGNRPEFISVKRSNKELKKYIGKYNQFGSEIELTVDKGSLKVSQGEQQIMLLHPMKGERFFC